jgi:hypothetical protein
MSTGPRISMTEYVSFVFLAMSCAYFFVPEVRLWVHHHLITFLASR